jgi:hypothetical protein
VHEVQQAGPRDTRRSGGTAVRVCRRCAQHSRTRDGSTRLRDGYQREIVPALMQDFGYTNRFAVPKLAKVVLNMVPLARPSRTARSSTRRSRR